MRKQALWEGLANAGFTLMGNKNLGAAGGAFLQGTNAARDNYMNTALDAYRLKNAEEERQYGRERDATADERWQMQWDYNKGRQQREDTRQNTLFDWQMDDRQRQEDMRAGQQSAVEGFSQDFTQQGGDLFDPGMQSWLRGQGVQGVDPADTQKYNKMQPMMQAQDYGRAYETMLAEPGKGKWTSVGKDSALFNEETGQWMTPPQSQGGANFEDEAKLRKEYMGEAQPFVDLRNNYQRVQASSQDQTGASDIALVYSFMKMLDPSSVVREGEFATAANAGGVDAKIVSLYNQVLNGQRLSPQVRSEFQQQAGRQFAKQTETYAAVRQKYDVLARQYGFDPTRVAPDVTYGVQLMPEQAAPAGDIDPEAVAQLKANPTPEMMDLFDQVFGEGAAASVLGGR
jgi:hypothetical protein